MRLWFVVLGLSFALGACGSRGSQGPAWPKAAEREIDGGESLEPRHATVIAEVKELTPVVTEAVKPTEDAAKPAEAATPDAATPASTTTIIVPEEEDGVTVEVIEIED